MTPGSYYLIAYIDPTNDVDEKDENNNIYVSPELFVVLNESIPPNAPSVPNLITDSGSSANDNITNDDTPTFGWIDSTDNLNGSGIAGYQWRVNDGEWSVLQTELYATTDILLDGSHTFSVRAKDNAGNIGPEASLTFTIDTFAEPPSIIAVDPDTGANSSDFVTNSSTIQVTGYAESGSSVQIFDSGVPMGQSVIASDGVFLVSLPPLVEGNHYLTAEIIDVAGNTSESSQALTVAIDTTPPQITNTSQEDDPITEIIVHFSEALDIADAEDANNYILKGAGGDSDFSNGFTGITINSATYNESENRVTLVINNGTELPNDLYQLVINGTDSIFDVAGNVLDGDGNSVAGGEYVYEFRAEVFPMEIPAKGLRFYDDNSLVTIMLKNGTGEAWFAGDISQIDTSKKIAEVFGENLYLASIILQASDETTKLTIKSKDKYNQTVLGGITGASLGKVVAKGIDLVGNIELSGSLGSLILDDISEYVTITTGAEAAKGFSVKVDDIGDDVQFDIAGTVKKFQATWFTKGSIQADNIGKVTIKESGFGVDIEARDGDILGVTAYNIIGDITASGTIKKLTSKYGIISGDICAQEIGTITSAKDITGDISANRLIGKIISKSGNFTGTARAGANIGTIKAIDLNDAIISAGTDIKKISMKGNVFNSYILAGYDIGTDCAFGLLETGGGDLPGSGNIKSVTAKGDFVRSYVCAGTLPYNSETMAALTDGLPFNGIFGSIGKVKFGGIDYLNATEEFGLFAVTDIKPFKIGKDKAEPRDYFNIDILLAG